MSNCKLQDLTSLPWEKFFQLFCVAFFLHGIIEGINTDLITFSCPEAYNLARGQLLTLSVLLSIWNFQTHPFILL